ncbi:MAG: signal peptidase I [Alphaproteobacteria bacterium]
MKILKHVFNFFFEDLTKGLWNFLKAVLIAGSLALAVRTIIAEPFHIPSGSMMPTLHIGDHLFVSKYPYGYSRYSMIFGPNLFSGRIAHKNPTRGDVVIFRAPKGKDDYIKRLVGLPNDEIQVKNGVLFINGKAVKKKLISDYEMVDFDRRWEKDTIETEGKKLAYARGQSFFIDGKKLKKSTYTLDYKTCKFKGQCGVQHLKKYKETLPNGVSYEVLDSKIKVPFDDTPVYKVPEKHYFVMGDNRDFSGDSRDMKRVGFIPQENLIGRAEFIFFSHNHRLPMLGLLYPLGWHKQIRLERFFNGL